MTGSDEVRGTFGMWLLAVLVLGGAVAISVWGSVQADGEAPAFALRSTGFENGVHAAPVNFTLDDYRGRTVVLDLMAVHCDACAYVTRDVMKPLWARHGNDTRFAILSIDTWADPATSTSTGSLPVAGWETDESLVGLQQDRNLTWRHALDTDQVWQKYAAIQLPRVVVVSPQGRIVYEEQGVPSLDAVEAAVQASLLGQAASVPILRLPLFGLAFAAGAASVLTPCTVGMLPAYLGMLLQEARAAPPKVRIRRSLLGGLAAAAGVVLLYLVLGILFSLFGAQLRAAIPWLGPAVGFGMVAMGLLAMAGRGLPGLGRAGSSIDGRRGFFVFGVAFGLAGFGCTGPLFLPLLLAGFLESTAMGITLFVLYAVAVALVVVLAAALVAEGAATRARRILDWTPGIQRLAGLLMAAAGAYLAYYFLAAPR